MKINKNINEKYTILIEQFDKKIKFFTIKKMHEALQCFIISNLIFELSKFFEKIMIDLIFKFEIFVINANLQLNQSQSNKTVVVSFNINSTEINNKNKFNVKINNFCNYC